MPEYPDNSHSGREAASPPEKKVDKVITGTAKTRKKSGAQKFAGAFLPEDVTSVKSYILRDVVVPGIKNAIADVVSIMLFGETGRIGGRKTNGSKVSYNRYYDDKRDDRREYGRPRAPGGFDYDDIVFETRGDAERVLDQLESVINIYGLASISEKPSQKCIMAVSSAAGSVRENLGLASPTTSSSRVEISMKPIAS